MKFIFSLFIFSFTTVLWAQETKPNTSFEYTRQISTRLEELAQLPAENYLVRIESYRTDMERYFDHKKRVCNGEFSAVILGDNTASSQGERSNRLTTEEKKLCFRELKAMQSTYLNSIYAARERFMDHLHEQRKQDLMKARENALKELDTSFNRKI